MMPKLASWAVVLHSAPFNSRYGVSVQALKAR